MLNSKMLRLRSDLAYAKLQARLLELKHKLTERDAFDFVSAASNGPTLLLGRAT